MKRFEYHPPTIWDLRLRLLKYEVDDTKLSDLLDDLARRRNTAARLAKGTVPRWFAVLMNSSPSRWISRS